MKHAIIMALNVLTTTVGCALASEKCTYHPIMTEKFSPEGISSRRIGPARWTSHTPWNGDFGDATFSDPGPEGPFAVHDGTLTITASKTPDGRWKSGLIAAADASGSGTGTRYGYFEARMKMPSGPGTWPAFWLSGLKPVGTEGKDGNVEIDVVEYYGKFISGYQEAVHVWFKDNTLSRAVGKEIKVEPGLLIADWHIYGVDISSKKITFFLDGQEVWVQPTPSELEYPMYPLVDLALGGGWPIVETQSPVKLEIQYVHVFSRDPGQAEDCQPGRPKE